MTCEIGNDDSNRSERTSKEKRENSNVTNTEEKRYECYECKQSFKSASILSRHVRSEQCHSKTNETASRNCVLHIGASYDEQEKVIPFTEIQLSHCHKKKEMRNAMVKKSKFDAIVLPIAVDGKLGYHARCLKYFGAVKCKQTAIDFVKDVIFESSTHL